MVSWHQEAVNEIVEKLKAKYSVKHPFNLPEQTRKGALYHPDVVVFKEESNEVMYIIEVQTRNVRKSICGAAILAEICVNVMKQSRKPTLFFVVKDDSNERELAKLDFRIQKIQESLRQPHLEKAEIQRKKEFMKNIHRL